MSPASSSFRIKLIVWSAILLVVPLASYTLYVLDRRPEINEYLSLSLKLAADRVEAVLSNISSNVANINASVARGDQSAHAAGQVEYWRSICTFLEYQRYLRLAAAPPVPSQGQPFGSCLKGLYDPSEQTGTTLEFRIVGPKALPDSTLVLQVRFDRILQDLPPDREFDYIVIADPEGRVAHERALTPAWDHRRDLHFTDVSQLYDTTGAQIDPKLLSGASRLSAARLGGREYQVFSQPVRVAPRGERPAETWILCGFVASSSVVSQAMAMPSAIILALLLVLVLGVLPWPFVKLALMGRRERLRFTDGYLLLFSTSAVLFLLTILILDTDNYWLNRQGDVTLRKLADLVERTMVDELRDMRDQLVAYDRQAVLAGLSETATRPCLVSDLLGTPRAEPRCLDLERPSYANLKHVFFARSDGSQFAKATVRTSNTAAISVASRDYFLRNVNGRLFRLQSDQDEKGRAFAVEAIRSLTTGEQETVLSIRSSLQRPEHGSKVIVAAISEEVPWADVMLLPEGYGFAIFSRDGSIVYHSDGRRAIDENVLDHVDRPRQLRAAILSGSERYFRSAYLTRPHELYVRPVTRLERAEWFLLTFRDSQALATLNTQAVAGALILALASIVLVQLGPSLLLVVGSGRRIRWLWPDPLKHRRYVGVSVVNLVLVLALSGIVWFADGAVLLSGCFALPAVGLLLMIVAYGRPTKRSTSPLEPSHQKRALRWHVVAAVLLWVLTSILPAVGFVRLSWTEQLTAYARYEALHIEELLTARRHFVEDAFQPVLIDERERFLDDWYERLNDAAEDASTLFPRLGAHGENTVSSRVLREVMQQYMPLYNDFSAALNFQSTDFGLADSAGLGFRVGVVAWVSLLVVLVCLVLWVRYSAQYMFLGSVPLSATRETARLEELCDRSRTLSEEERLAFVQVAEEGIVNPKQGDIVRKLIAGGFLVRDPELRPASSRLAHCIRDQIEPSKITALERGGAGLRWSEVRWVILVVLASIGALLFLTQRGLFDATTGLIAALALTAPNLLRFVDFLRGPGGGSPSS